jgi:hypothetical protein
LEAGVESWSSKRNTGITKKWCAVAQVRTDAAGEPQYEHRTLLPTRNIAEAVAMQVARKARANGASYCDETEGEYEYLLKNERTGTVEPVGLHTFYVTFA